MPSDLPKISICTAVWNGLDFTKEFIHSLKKNSALNFELIVVDNGSSQETSEHLFQEADCYYRFKSNQGFCKGFNKAAALASTDLLVLTNNDTVWPEENWQQEVLREFKSLKNCGLLIPCANNILNPPNLRKAKGKRILKLPKWQLPVASGVVFIIKKDLFFRLRGFDESYGTSGEDQDLQFKVWQAGYDIYITEKIFVDHIGKATSQRLPCWEKLWEKNYEKFLKKWGHKIKGQSFFKKQLNRFKKLCHSPT